MAQQMSLLGERIKTARLAQGWTQTQLAQRVGTTKKSIGIWERTGTISALSLGRLTTVLPGLNVQGEWVEEAPLTNGATRTIRRLTMEAPLPELTASEPAIDTLRRLRRELTKITAELDAVVSGMERSSL
jgi:transcriptional regulator with XRE-family HTH domain